jgi:hypothetical protein
MWVCIQCLAMDWVLLTCLPSHCLITDHVIMSQYFRHRNFSGVQIKDSSTAMPIVFIWSTIFSPMIEQKLHLVWKKYWRLKLKWYNEYDDICSSGMDDLNVQHTAGRRKFNSVLHCVYITFCKKYPELIMFSDSNKRKFELLWLQKLFTYISNFMHFDNLKI